MLFKFMEAIRKFKTAIEKLDISAEEIAELKDAFMMLIGVFMTKKEPLFGAAGVEDKSGPVSDEERDEAVAVLCKMGMSKSQAETTVEHVAS